MGGVTIKQEDSRFAVDPWYNQLFLEHMTVDCNMAAQDRWVVGAALAPSIRG
jgi:hypothetical protein